MSLDNIQLPSIVLQELFKKSLIDSETVQSVTYTKKKEPLILGKNKKRITIIVNDDEALYLPDEQLNFLLEILSACNLTLEDVALINIKKDETLSYKIITNDLKAEKIFLFGIEPSKIELPVQFPNYQAQKFNNQLYLSAPLLTKLQNDKAEKTKLWLCLKQIFSI